MRQPPRTRQQRERRRSARDKTKVCATCRDIEDVTDLDKPYVIRKCPDCGREMKLRPSAKHGTGIRVKKGDRFVLPAAFITVSANPLKGNSNLTRYGLNWFAEKVFEIDISSKENRDNFPDLARRLMELSENYFKDAPYLKDLDFQNTEDAEEIFKRINAHPKSIEWWGYMAGGMCSIALQAISDGDAPLAAWAMATSERFRALTVFKSNFEEAAFIGHSARRLVELLHTWDANKENGDEGFWQLKVAENAFAIAQLFSVPVALIQGHAYVGGTRISGTDGRIVDFLFSGGIAKDAILVEIKSPTAKLLGPRYRQNVYPPGKELSGAVVQVSDYLHVLRENIEKLASADTELSTFNPRRVIICGNHEKELADKRRRTSFELFRSSLAGIDVITFDEFFRKVELLAGLFHLTRKGGAEVR